METMTFELEVLYIVAIYVWLPPASYVVFLTTLVKFSNMDVTSFFSELIDEPRINHWVLITGAVL